MSTLKQIEANRRNSQVSSGPKTPAGKAVSCMNRLETGIDAQSQIIPGEDPEALERLTGQYYDRFYPQGPEEVALIDSAIASDWLLRRLRKTEAEMWNRSIAREVENQRKWGKEPEKYPMAAAFLDQQKALDRLQRRISAAERSLRASLETFARLRKQSLAAHEVGQTLSSGNTPDQPSPPPPVGPMPPATPSEQTVISKIGFGPEIFPAASPEPTGKSQSGGSQPELSSLRPRLPYNGASPC